MSTIDLGSFTAAQGITLLYPTFFSPRQIGTSVATTGDVNADGIDDFLIGSGNVGAFIVYGQSTGLPATIDLSTLTASQGVQLLPPASVGPAIVSAPAGDVNGDGIADVMLARIDDTEGWVVYGQAGGIAALPTLASLTPAQGFSFTGAGGRLGSVGDVNGDGIDDIAMSNTFTSNVYVVYGQAGGLAGPLDLATLSVAQGTKVLGASGSPAVASAGDVNGDGVGDLLIGSFFEAAAYVVYGTAAGLGATLDLTTLTSAQGFRIAGLTGSQAGWSVAAAGDTNGDGLGDLLIATPDGAGAYLLYGPSTPTLGPVSLSGLTPSQGFRMDMPVPGDASSPRETEVSVAAAGDVNGDGLADIIIGVDEAQIAGGKGAAYVVYGQAGVRPGPVALGWLAETEGFAIVGAALGDFAGRAVSSAGDVNGDGVGDVLVGVPGINTVANPSQNAGAAYIVYGPNQPVTWTGGAGAETKLGGSFDDVLNGGAGNDSLDAKGGQDSLLGGADNDSLAGGTGTDLLDGGAGNDSLDGGAGADTMIGGAGHDTYVVDDAGDVLLEDAAGLSTVLSSVTWTLAANFLDLTLSGAAAIDGTGNSRQNWMIGNEAANRLSGSGGDDLLEGRDGKDRLTGGGGHDLLRGEAGRDNLNGGSGDDSLDGGAEADKLSGGTGADRFIFSVAPVAKQSDTVSDFSAAQGDRIEILRAAFDPGGTSGLGLGQLSLQAGRFEANLAGQATAATTRFVYDTDAGSLLWDADGTGATKAVEVARFTGLPALSAADLWLV